MKENPLLLKNVLEVYVILLEYQVGHIVRISKYKNIFAKGYTPNWSERVFIIKKVKNTVP